MKRAQIRRRDLVAAVTGGAVAIMLAGGVAWAAIGDGGVIQGCYDSGGNVKVVSALPCPKGYTPFQWNQQGLKGDPGPQGPPGTNGQNGAPGDPGKDGHDGVSVTSEAEPAGANCPNGGSKFTAANGITYACDGPPGADGGGTGVDSLADLDGIPCQLPGAFGTFLAHVTLGPSGEVAISCGVAKNLNLRVTAHCLIVLCTDNRAVIHVATGAGPIGQCASVNTFPANPDVTTSCLFPFPVGTSVTLTAEVPGTKMLDWGGACLAAGSNTVCQLTMDGPQFADLDYH